MQAFDIAPPEPGEATRDTIFPLRRAFVIVLGMALIGGLLLASYHLFLPVRGFPAGESVEIPEDVSVGEMGRILHEAGAIRSPFLFRALTRITLQDRSLASGIYIFERPLALASIVYRLSANMHGIAPVRLTFTEGMTVSDIANELERGVPGFDTEAFLELASTSEGYLFPDTYFFMPSVSPSEVVERLSERFSERIATIAEELEASDRPLLEVVIMASLLEREAKTPEDMRMVAGILWSRLDDEMLLQVDAPFGYIRGENGYVPTLKDLELDSRYNTYKYEGLPPTPIANPGLTALRAAMGPTKTEYVYYLTGRDGKMHYGHTFEEHKRNRELYL